MRNPFSIIVIALGAFILAAPATAPARERVVAYIPNWVDVKAFAETIDYARITHINIAFENPTSENGDLSFNDKNDILISKARANHVKILISIGGGSASTDKPLSARYAALLTQPRRADFVRKLTDYVTKHNLDGLDVDIEGPAINEDFGPFIADMGNTFKPKGLLLTAALSKGYGGTKVPDAVFAHLDFVNIMAYDATGPWNPKSPGQHASLQFAKENVKYWLDRGLPKDKSVLGVPFYGYGFGEAFRKRDYPYKTIIAEHPGAEQVDQVGNTIWYNGIPTIRAKAKYVADEGLGGIMIWSLDYDAKGNQSLLTAVHETLASTRPAGNSTSAPAIRPTLSVLDRTTRPLLVADQPWEDYCIGYCQVMKLPDGWHMWYGSYDHTYRNDADGHFCYARSKDGANWVKPHLGLVEFNGSRDNNILIARGIHGHCIVVDPKAPPAERFKMVFCNLTADAQWPVYGGTSPDGIHWKLSEKPLLNHNSDTQQSLLLDGDVFRLYVRMWTGQRAFSGNRIVGYSEGKNFSAFTDPVPVLQADREDPANMQFYNSAVSKVSDDLYLMLSSALYTGEDAVRVHAALSSDGQHFQRIGNRPLLELGKTFDRMGMYVAPGAIPADRPNEFWFYYTGASAGHDASTPDKLKYGGAIGRFRLKLNR